ncbi:hypothetical protein KKD49_14115, partial [Myxococcota bacterium]|nr:hypothetical protein [Myxococcota bacterium]
IKNSIRPLVINSTPCGYCPERKSGEKFEKLYFRTVTKSLSKIELTTLESKRNKSFKTQEIY